MSKHKRRNTTNISNQVRERVIRRDKYCIFCGSSYNLTIAHYIPRSLGGLGIEENLTVACANCHMQLDQGKNRKKYQAYQLEYLNSLYPNITDDKRKYKKWKI